MMVEQDKNPGMIDKREEDWLIRQFKKMDSKDYKSMREWLGANKLIAEAGADKQISAAFPNPRRQTKRVESGLEETLPDFKKEDSSKAMMGFLPWAELEEIAKVLDYGAQKYERGNWRKPVSWLRLVSACVRHISAWCRGQDKDPDTGFSHLHHAVCSLLFLAHHQRKGTGTDDRFLSGSD
jgi:hypothetical protein